MKRVLIFVIFTALLAGSISFAIAENQTNGDEKPIDCLSGPCPDGYICEGEGGMCLPHNTSSKIVGASCGTVTPGYQDQCCRSKGYTGWDSENFTCIGEKEDNETKDNETGLVGASCGTVTPGENNECCINKGYVGWDQKKFKCVGEKEDNETGLNDNKDNVLGAHFEDKENCEAWNCTKWSACLNGTETRKCTKTSFNCTEDNKIPRLKKNCSEKEELKFYNKTRDCPEECVCSGSTIKCTSENGTRVMTIYAGNSGNVIVQIQNLNMSTNVTLYKADGKVYGIFKGNITREVKLPDDIKERLQNHTRTKFYNESIDLNGDGKYSMNATKKARLFWLIPVREHVKAEVNAETGETIRIRNPWWGFLAKDVKD